MSRIAETLGGDDSLLIVFGRASLLDARDKTGDERGGLADTGKVSCTAASGA